MKRPIKPFVVEVRKGSKNQKKKTPVTDLLPFDMLEEKPRENGALKRAEAALFKAAPKAEESVASSRSGRILCIRGRGNGCRFCAPNVAPVHREARNSEERVLLPCR